MCFREFAKIKRCNYSVEKIVKKDLTAFLRVNDFEVLCHETAPNAQIKT
jgi:hypothetical protein